MDGASPSIIINSVDLKRLLAWMDASELSKVADYLSHEIEVLGKAGADFAALTANTPHIVFDKLRERTSLPLVSIVEAACQNVKSLGMKTAGLIGTRYTMEESFLLDRLAGRGVEAVVPPAPARAEVHRIIYDELVRDVVREESRATYRGIMADLVTDGAEGMILGCTEIGLLLGANDTTVPVFDTTEIHAGAAVDWMLSPSR